MFLSPLRGSRSQLNINGCRCTSRCCACWIGQVKMSTVTRPVTYITFFLYFFFYISDHQQRDIFYTVFKIWLVSKERGIMRLNHNTTMQVMNRQMKMKEPIECSEVTIFQWWESSTKSSSVKASAKAAQQCLVILGAVLSRPIAHCRVSQSKLVPRERLD